MRAARSTPIDPERGRAWARTSGHVAIAYQMHGVHCGELVCYLHTRDRLHLDGMLERRTNDMLPPSLYERITAINRAWEAKASVIADAEERAQKYRAIYGAYTFLMESAFRIETASCEGEQIARVVELENCIRGFERTLRHFELPELNGPAPWAA
jgi:hypothetical protein